MSSGGKCKECGTTIPADSPRGFCAQCLLGLGLQQVQSPKAEVRSLESEAAGRLAEKAGDRIGRYRLLQEIGHGGCGVVYMAEQEEPVRRKVALKVIKLGMDTKQVVARFEAERQALALMDHPNIAKVLDAGSTDTGRPFFVMELVGGIKITDYCDQNHLPTRQRLDQFIQVCRAIQHAHQKGIIHRDIKPSNILVATQDGMPVPKVIDFGIAKATQGRLTDQTLFTAFEQFIGTPAYMSPEQAQLGGVDVDTRSDIYSLGVLLYELLTGTTPFDTKELVAAGLDEMRRTIREVDPVKPSTRLTEELVAAPRQSAADSTDENGGALPRRRYGQIQELIHSLRGDLDWIVMKCLEKERARRYETANGLARDIERHLNDEAVVASPPSRFYRFQKAVRRNKTGFTAAVVVAAILVTGVVVSTWEAIHARRAERDQIRLRQQAQAAEVNAMRERKKAESEASKSEQVARFLKETLKSADSSVAMGRDTTMMREILDNTAKRISVELAEEPDVQADLGFTIAKVYIELSEHAKAEAMYRQVLALQTNLFGTEDTNVAASLAGVAGALEGQGKNIEAEKVAREALGIQRRLLGKNCPQSVPVLNLLALIVGDQGRLAEREATAREALEIERGQQGEDHALMLTYVLHTLAYTLYLEGKYAEAEAPYREALAITRETGATDQTMGHLLNNLALTLDAQGKLDEAESLFREALALRKQLFGNEHPDVAVSLANLAVALGQQAEMSGVSQSQRKLGEAEALCYESAKILRHKSPPDAAQLAGTLAELTSVLISEGKFTAAEPIAKECQAIREQTIPEDWRTFNSRSQLGATLLGQKQYAEAEPFLISGYQGMKQRENMMPLSSKPRIKAALRRLTQLYEATGRPDRAAEWKAKLEEYEQSQSPNSTSTQPLH
jgi:eukaryotic-like serine/threonine-protein kinase